MRQGLALAICALIVTAGTAQTQPDFTGRWILEATSGAATRPARSMTVAQPVVRTNAAGAPMPPHYTYLNVERHFETGSESDSYHIGVMGGTFGGVSNDFPSTETALRTTTGVLWDRDQLVIEKSGYSRGKSRPRTYRREVWRLDQSDRLIITITERTSDRLASVHVVTYRKQ